ncbi:MAG: glycosyltransferase family 2 protein [Deltaproteobacteria bacterium]|nr:glycosyltransferase family 2 protein [Deltaproteobacteria bacterium]
MASERILIFIVAYNATSHIRSVLDRLPREVFNDPRRFHVLIIDDCSKDETARTASAHASDFKFENVTVLRNTINQGYGGNQKIGYRYAVQRGFDLVILLHGDGQYAPELVLEFVNKWKSDGGARADVVLGSRMINKDKAREGGMPFYKWVGNQVLTAFQNVVVGSGLSEFHTGYRAYDTRLLAKIPFELCTNEFHFDTEILLQAFALEAKVVEFQIPTHYGDEICHVDGLKYAKDVARECLIYRFQKIGFFVSMKYRGLLKRDDEGRRGSTQNLVVERIRPSTKVLNLGAESKFLETRLRERGCDYRSRPLPAEGVPAEDVSGYDYVLVLDVLEGLSDSERFLVDLRYGMRDQKAPKLVFSTGNVAFVGLRVLLGLGLFNYGERGILRVNHKRLFTLASFRRLLRETGYVQGSVRGIGVPFHLLFPGRSGRWLSALSDRAARAWPSLFAYQFLIEATPRPHSFMLLGQAERFYEAESGGRAYQ